MHSSSFTVPVLKPKSIHQSFSCLGFLIRSIIFFDYFYFIITEIRILYNSRFLCTCRRSRYGLRVIPRSHLLSVFILFNFCLLKDHSCFKIGEIFFNFLAFTNVPIHIDISLLSRIGFTCHRIAAPKDSSSSCSVSDSVSVSKPF